MKDPNKRDCLDYVDLTIEGNEDLSVRPWRGPAPLNPNPIVKTSESLPRENLHAFIVNDEDLTVRPWRQATATPAGNGGALGPIGPQDLRERTFRSG